MRKRVPIPSRLGVGRASYAPPSGSRVEPRLQMHFGEFLAVKMFLTVAIFMNLVYKRVMNWYHVHLIPDNIWSRDKMLRLPQLHRRIFPAAPVELAPMVINSNQNQPSIINEASKYSYKLLDYHTEVFTTCSCIRNLVAKRQQSNVVEF